MNHEVVCAMWAAHNRGRSTIRVEHFGLHGRGSYTKEYKVRSQARGSRISFDGATIKSHHWWPMARFVTNESGEVAVLYRSHHYSVSTGRHRSEVRSALRKYAPEVPLFDVEDAIDSSPKLIIEDYMARVRKDFDAALRARTRAAWYVRGAADTEQEMRRFAEFYGIEIPAWTNPFATAAEIDKLEKKLVELSIKDGVIINAFWRRT